MGTLGQINDVVKFTGIIMNMTGLEIPGLGGLFGGGGNTTSAFGGTSSGRLARCEVGSPFGSSGFGIIRSR